MRHYIVINPRLRRAFVAFVAFAPCVCQADWIHEGSLATLIPWTFSAGTGESRHNKVETTHRQVPRAVPFNCKIVCSGRAIHVSGSAGCMGSCESTKNVRIHLVGRGQTEINIAWDNEHQFRSKVRYATASCTVFAVMHACCSEHGIDVATALIEMLTLLTDAWGDPCTWTHVRALLLAFHTSLAHSHCAAAPPGGSAFERRTA